MDSTNRFLGIDFGTCYSSMACINPETGHAEIVRNAEGEEKTRSIVYFGKSEGDTLVGKLVEDMLADEETQVRVFDSAKRDIGKKRGLLLGDRKVTPLDVVVEVLRKLKRDAEEFHFHAEVPRTVITVPAIFDQLEREKVQDAGRLAGFQEVELLEEPVAAALAYLHDGLEVGRRIFVYDLGAGTLDLAVLAREGEEELPTLVLPPRGLRKGGNDFDLLLYRYVDQKAKEENRSVSKNGAMNPDFLRRCREQKENLSHRPEVQFSYILPDGRPFRYKLERKTLEAIIEEIVAETVEQAENLLEDARKAGHEIDNVVLIGGSSRVPLVALMLQEKLPVKPQKWQHQDIAVALGAAYHAEALWGRRESDASRDRGDDCRKELLGAIVAGVVEAKAKMAAQPFCFRSGGLAYCLDDLIPLCRSHPEDAEWHLMSGHFETWLHDTGHVKLAYHVRALGESGRNTTDCLLSFLRECGPG